MAQQTPTPISGQTAKVLLDLSTIAAKKVLMEDPSAVPEATIHATLGVIEKESRAALAAANAPDDKSVKVELSNAKRAVDAMIDNADKRYSEAIANATVAGGNIVSEGITSAQAYSPQPASQKQR